MEIAHQETIYIPIWLDLLSVSQKKDQKAKINLHSNMVRFIMKSKREKEFIMNLIYIPIWLDLLLKSYFKFSFLLFYLHSNMVRFIINILNCSVR